ncbi:MAG: HNH endonuclease [Desulfurellales bacterium]|nr:MAG: HNH endonuclease [Desulfurellales bacterium]
MTETQIKEAVRTRDGLRCRDCGMTNDEHLVKYGKALHVHRLIPGSMYEEDHCVTLCYACHGPKPKKPEDLIWWDSDRTGVLLLCINTYTPDGRRITAYLKDQAMREGREPADVAQRVLSCWCDSFPEDYSI